MKIKIFYLTGTGNTRRAAKLVEIQLNSMGHDCEIIDWLHNDFEAWDDADAFGFAAPVHAFREPTALKEKLKKLPKFTGAEKKLVFIIACCEGMAGAFFSRINKILKKKKVKTIGTLTYFGPSNVLMWKSSFNRSQKTVDPQKDNAALQFGKNLPELIERNVKCKIKRKYLSALAAKMSQNWGLRISMLKGGIKVDKEKCNKCGLCANNCMGRALTLDPYPVYNKKKCIVCLQCINLCPKDALDTKATKGLERFKGLGKIEALPLP